MSFVRLSEVRRGRLVLKVLKRRHSDELLLAVDVVRMDRVVFGVLLSWPEVQSLFDFVRGDVQLPVLRMPVEEPEQLGLEVFSGELSRAEIGMAIRVVSGAEENQSKRSAITVLPSLPEFRYVYTCPNCGCHVPSIFRVPSNDGERLRLCSNCQHVYEVLD